MSKGAWGPLSDRRSATAVTIIQSKQVFLAVPSLVLFQTLPPTGHPEARCRTMPERTQPPAPGSSMEVTSSKKIVLFQSPKLAKHRPVRENSNTDFYVHFVCSCKAVASEMKLGDHFDDHLELSCWSAASSATVFFSSFFRIFPNTMSKAWCLAKYTLVKG